MVNINTNIFIRTKAITFYDDGGTISSERWRDAGDFANDFGSGDIAAILSAADGFDIICAKRFDRNIKLRFKFAV